MKYAIVLGTRPEIIKMSPIIRFLEKENTPKLIFYWYLLQTIVFIVLCCIACWTTAFTNALVLKNRYKTGISAL